MSDPDLLEVPASPVPRDRWGRPLIIPPQGGKPVPYTRCTTFIGCLEDTYQLGLWQQRMVTVGLALRPDLLLQATALAHDPAANKHQLDEVAAAAREHAGASAAATIGTALHALTERIDRGLPVGVVPDSYRGHLAAYQQATQALHTVGAEVFTVCDQLQIGGTPDRIVTVAGEPGLFIADVKTGDLIDNHGKIAFGALKIAMQMAVYAHSEIYDPATGNRQKMPDLRTDKAVLIALNAKTGDCQLRWIDLTLGWEAVQTAAQVRAWRKREPEVVQPFSEPATTATTATGLRAERLAALEQAIAQASSAEQLTNIWAYAQQEELWADRHTELAKARLAELTGPLPATTTTPPAA